MTNARRLKRLVISPEFFLEFFKGRSGLLAQIAENPLPPDTKVVCMNALQDMQTFVLIVESETFPLVEEGTIIPEVEGIVLRLVQPTAPVLPMTMHRGLQASRQ